MQLLTNRIKNFFLDLFFPKNCLGCKQPGTYLCRDCFNKIPLAENNACFFCEKITGKGRTCFDCKKEIYLDRVISAAEYKNLLVRELIRAFKYYYVQELSKPLAQLLINQLRGLELKFNNSEFLIIPIPLHCHRLKYRGFNQAELIAKKMTDQFNLDIVTDALERKSPSTPQAKIKDIEKRKLNLQNIFSIKPETAGKIKDKIILLIDDVITTGATMNEAAKVLKESGAKEVWALAIAKG